MDRLPGETYRRKEPVIKRRMVVAHVYSVGFKDRPEEIVETRRLVPPRRVRV